MTSGKRNYLLLSLFDFLYLFAWSSTMAFFVIWTTQHLGISATKTGLLDSVNAFIAPAGGPLLYLRLRAAAGAQLLVWRLAGRDLSGDHL